MSSNEKGMEIDKEKMAEEIQAQESDSIEDESFDENAKYLNDMFEQDGLEVPDSLSRINIESMLAKQSKPVKKRIWQKPIAWAAAIAACFLLVAVPVLRSGQAAAAELTTFKSYDEIYKMIDQINSSITYGKDIMTIEEDAEAVPNESGQGKQVIGREYGAQAKGGAVGGAGKGAHSDTYIQVEGVDEADKVKVDDRYIYFIDSTRTKVLIYEADNGKAAKVSSIAVSGDEQVEEIFLHGNQLTVIVEHYDYNNGNDTKASVYDITDRAHPEKTSDYVQSGFPVSQRMVGTVLYLVTDQYVYGKEIPYCGSDKETNKLKAEDISCVPSPAYAEYTIVGAVDTASGKELKHVTKAVFGGSQDIYANGDNLYIAGTTYINRKKIEQGGLFRKFISPAFSGDPATMVIKVRMANGNIKILDSSVVKGTIDDQFSMDEKDGEFRIATTSVTDSGERVNNLFVLDKGLDVIGQVSGFARGESIKAVRYVKNKAYVITYEETDPLFVIDLSDSRDPKIDGEVKIDGFSTLLVPLSEDRLLGIGYGTKQVESWQETSGLKFALFDISDPSKPSVVTSKDLEEVFSEVQEDHRALVVLGEGEKVRFILPCFKRYEEYAVDDAEMTEDGEDYKVYTEAGPRGGVLEVEVPGDVIDIIRYKKTEQAVSRCPVIGNYIYAICDDDTVVPQKLAE